MNHYIAILNILAVYFVSFSFEVPIVKISDGYLRGKYMSSRNGRVFSAFLGVPYAAAPVGALRFLPPMSPRKWEDVRNATEEGNICSQGKYGGHEDCLSLNIFTHQNQSNPSLPVMFYIHGGSFYMSSPALGITGPEYLMDRDIVLVTVRYRLGPFGFLSTEDSVIPGNMGLKDQVQALQWVEKNIKIFGGDPDKVTLFGCSAGGSSVHLHMQSPTSQSLFVRGISQSGTSLGAYALMGKGCAKKYTLQLAEFLNCSMENARILQCLQQKTTNEIEGAYQILQNSRYAITKSIFRPVIEKNSDNAFITSSPFHVTTHKPWLTGITANEGALNIRLKYLNYTIDQIKSAFNVYGPKALLFEDICMRKKETADLIHDFYFKNGSTTQKIIKSIEEMFTDWWFLWPVEQSIRNHRGILYYYLYDHRGEHSYTEIYDSPQDLGVSHLDDLLPLFRHAQYFKELNQEDTNISRLMVNFWVNFATYGNPTPHPISRNPQTNDQKDFIWRVSNNSDPTHNHIQTHRLSMETKMQTKRLSFWKQINVVENVTRFECMI